MAHGAFDNDVEALMTLRHFFNFIPLSNKGEVPGILEISILVDIYSIIFMVMEEMVPGTC